MANLPGTNIIAPIRPFSTDDIFATHEAIWGKGGYRTVQDLNERDSIKELRRENLMLCSVIDNSFNNSTSGREIYILDINHDSSTSTSLLDNNNWIPLNLGGGDDWVFPPPPKSIYTGKKGQRSFDDNFLYICIEDDLWKRVAFDFFEDGSFGNGTNGTNGILANGVVPIWCDDEWCYEPVVKNIEPNITGGTDGATSITVTFTDDTTKDIPLGDSWILPPPLTSMSVGIEGQRSYDDKFLYVCIADNLWKRTSYDFFIFSGSTSGNSGTLDIDTGSVPIWDDALKTWNYDLVVEDVSTTSGTSGNVLITYTDKSQKLLDILGGDNWTTPPPISSSFPGTEGQRSYDGNFLYICVSDNLWKRINLDLFLFNASTSGIVNLSLPDGVVPTWNDLSDNFDYDVLIKNVEITSNVLNITYSNDSSTSYSLSNVGSLNDLSDTTILSANIGDILTFNGSKWVNLPNSGSSNTSGANFIADLFDVTVTTPNINDLLIFDGVKWINSNIAINDYTTAGLSTINYVDSTFVTNTDFSSSTSSIFNEINILKDTINPPNKGDLITSNGTSSIILPTGTNGQILEVDDTTQSGLIWKDKELISLKNSYLISYSLSEEVVNSNRYFFSWRSSSHLTGNYNRSGSVTGISDSNNASPIIIPFNGIIKSATLNVRGTAVNNPSVSYPVNYNTNLYSLGFETEQDSSINSGNPYNLSFPIQSSDIVSRWSALGDGATNSKITIPLNINVSNGEMLSLKFINTLGDSNVSISLGAYITLLIEES